MLGTVEGLKKFVQMRESPYHGLNFCQGTVGEMLDDPREEIADVIRWFGTRGKIFNVHFRNIKGRKLSFMEVFPDEGDMDMWDSLKIYAEVGLQIHDDARPRADDLQRTPDDMRPRSPIASAISAALLQVLAETAAGRRRTLAAAGIERAPHRAAPFVPASCGPSP